MPQSARGHTCHLNAGWPMLGSAPCSRLRASSAMCTRSFTVPGMKARKTNLKKGVARARVGRHAGIAACSPARRTVPGHFQSNMETVCSDSYDVLVDMVLLRASFLSRLLHRCSGGPLRAAHRAANRSLRYSVMVQISA